MKTPPRLLPISSVALTTAPATPSTIVTNKLSKTPPSKLARSLGVIEVEKEFVAETIDTFYKSLKKMYLFGVEGFNQSIRVSKGGPYAEHRDHQGFGGTDQATSLELIVEDLEQDVGEWRRLNSSNLTLYVEEKVKHLSEHMQRTYAEMQQELEVKSQELKSLAGEKIKIADAIDASNNALADANKQL